MTRMPRFFASMALLAMASAQATPQLVDGNKRLQLGRYTTAEAQPQPHLNEPLALVAQLTFPREQVTTVGEAIEYTLLRTGYALVDSQSLTSDARRFSRSAAARGSAHAGPVFCSRRSERARGYGMALAHRSHHSPRLVHPGQRTQASPPGAHRQP